jgi:hypothetical protein
MYTIHNILLARQLAAFSSAIAKINTIKAITTLIYHRRWRLMHRVRVDRMQKSPGKRGENAKGQFRSPCERRPSAFFFTALDDKSRSIDSCLP